MKISSSLLVLLLLGACRPPAGPQLDAATLAPAADPAALTVYDLRPDQYGPDYDAGFGGHARRDLAVDYLAGSQNLLLERGEWQWHWSRLAAAAACGLPVDGAALLPALQQRYGADRTVHQQGLELHRRRAAADPLFCTVHRTAELEALRPAWQAGQLPDIVRPLRPLRAKKRRF